METPQQYTARILSNLEGHDPFKVLKSTPKKIGSLIADISRKKLYRKPHPAQWSIAEIVAHLAETEIVLAWRYRSIVEKNGVILQPFEQDGWAMNSQYIKTDIHQMLELFSVLRRANITFLGGLSKQQREHYGMHQERGKETINHLINLEAGHDLNHLKQIKKIIAK